jgi:hypothetical protein
VFGLPALDLPRGRDYHREGTEVADAGQDAHASTDGAIEAGGLGEDVDLGENQAAAMKEKSGPEKVRVHGDYCTTPRQNRGRSYVGTLLKFLRHYVGTAIFRAKFQPENGLKQST